MQRIDCLIKLDRQGNGHVTALFLPAWVWFYAKLIILHICSWQSWMSRVNVEHGLDFATFLICSYTFNRKVVVNVSTAFSVSILNYKRCCVVEKYTQSLALVNTSLTALFYQPYKQYFFGSHWILSHFYLCFLSDGHSVSLHWMLELKCFIIWFYTFWYTCTLYDVLYVSA